MCVGRSEEDEKREEEKRKALHFCAVICAAGLRLSEFEEAVADGVEREKSGPIDL